MIFLNRCKSYFSFHKSIDLWHMPSSIPSIFYDLGMQWSRSFKKKLRQDNNVKQWKNEWLTLVRDIWLKSNKYSSTSITFTCFYKFIPRKRINLKQHWIYLFSNRLNSAINHNKKESNAYYCSVSRIARVHRSINT